MYRKKQPANEGYWRVSEYYRYSMDAGGAEPIIKAFIGGYFRKQSIIAYWEHPFCLSSVKKRTVLNNERWNHDDEKQEISDVLQSMSEQQNVPLAFPSAIRIE